MNFTWEKFDPSFLKAVLLASEEFEDEYTTPGGEEIAVFGHFGYDG